MSAARERAGRALYTRYDTIAFSEGLEEAHDMSDTAHRASLVENDAALVEAIIGAMSDVIASGTWSRRQLAEAAIIAARRHITGEGA